DNLLQGATYYYRIRGESVAGSGVSRVGSFQLDTLSGLNRVFPSAPPEANGFLFLTLHPPGIGGWRFVGEQQWRQSGVPVGGLATGDVTQLLSKVIAYLPSHRQRNTPEKVDFVTGSGSRSAASGYSSRGVDALVTDLGVIVWRDGVAALAEINPWTTPDDVAGATGFPIDVQGAGISAPPSEQELEALAHIDPSRLRDGEFELESD
ncbi:MAG: hypothetical protein GY953_03325, partial [bacterium]|nr:hypothetical protein [bacterium]